MYDLFYALCLYVDLRTGGLTTFCWCTNPHSPTKLFEVSCFCFGGQGAVVWWMVNRNFHLFRWMCSSVPMYTDGKAHLSWWGQWDRRAFRITWHYFQSPQSLSFIFNALNVVSMRRIRGLKSFLTFKEFGQMTRQRTSPQECMRRGTCSIDI